MQYSFCFLKITLGFLEFEMYLSGRTERSFIYLLQCLVYQSKWILCVIIPLLTSHSVWFLKESMHFVETTEFDFCETDVHNVPLLLGKIYSIW